MLLFLCYLLIIDSDMVRAAITPSAECQRIAVKWMKEFFNIQGDHSPDSNDIMLQIMLKSNAYDNYGPEALRIRIKVQGTVECPYR